MTTLRRRLKHEPRLRARMSHAVRSRTSEQKRFEVDSTVVDELVAEPLPSLEQQLDNLLRWIADRVEDDRLGTIDLPTSEFLAGIVGVVDGERVNDLLTYASKKNLVSMPTLAWEVKLTPEAWSRLEQASSPADAEPRPPGSTQPAGAIVTPEVVKAPCNACGGERNAFRRATHTKRDESHPIISSSDTYDLLECCGCGEISVRRQHWFSEHDSWEADPLTGEPVLVPGITTTHWPPPIARPRPAWAGELPDEVLRTLADELYVALEHGLSTLAAIAARTLLDRAMFLRVGDFKSGFQGKLDAMAAGGYVSSAERDTLEAMTDAGSAAAHRGYTPDPGTLAAIISTVENFLERSFILVEAGEVVRKATPPRPSRS